MGKYFSDAVEQAIADIYYCYDREKARRAMETAFQAAKTDGDPDAYYILSRCYFGAGNSWDFHPFTENRATANAMLHESVARGSAIGVLGALRMDLLTPALQEDMPFPNIKEAWEAVKEKADAGCPFCQYMIGSSYYFLDVIEIENISEQDFPDRGAWTDWLREQLQKCLPYLENAYRGGMGLAGRSLVDYYRTGRGDVIVPDKKTGLEWERVGAELGYPEWQYRYGFDLYHDAGRQEEGCRYARKAIDGGHLYAWEIIGDACREGKLVPLDFQKAVGCYEKAGNSPYAQEQIACLYLLGAQGVPQDHPRAVRLLTDAYRNSNGKQAGAELGVCCLLGWGCARDIQRGRELLEASEPSAFRGYGLGMMYAEGIGVKRNISKGVKLLKEAGDFAPAREALTHYKRGFLGIWKRIKDA